MKQSRSLERHYHRGLRRVGFHAALSMIAFAATALTQFRIGGSDPLWMVRRMA